MDVLETCSPGGVFHSLYQAGRKVVTPRIQYGFMTIHLRPPLTQLHIVLLLLNHSKVLQWSKD